MDKLSKKKEGQATKICACSYGSQIGRNSNQILVQFQFLDTLKVAYSNFERQTREPDSRPGRLRETEGFTLVINNRYTP